LFLKNCIGNLKGGLAMKRTFESLVKEISLPEAVIACYAVGEKPTDDPMEKWRRQNRPALPEGTLEKLSFDNWLAILRTHRVRIKDPLYEVAHESLAKLADTPEQCKSYLRHFGVELDIDHQVLERLITVGDFLDLREIRHRIPFKDPLVAVWIKRFVDLAEESGDFDHWLDVCEKAEPKSPERQLALRKMCELEGMTFP